MSVRRFQGRNDLATTLEPPITCEEMAQVRGGTSNRNWRANRNGTGERRNLEPRLAGWVGGRQPANKESKIKDFGAGDRKNLEPAQLGSILDELEQWGQFLRSDPEIIHTLKSFDEVARDTNSEPRETKKRTMRRPGPSL